MVILTHIYSDHLLLRVEVGPQDHRQIRLTPIHLAEHCAVELLGSGSRAGPGPKTRSGHQTVRPHPPSFVPGCHLLGWV